MPTCKECVHFDWDGRNPNYMGNCDDCIHNPNYTDYFTPNKNYNNEVL